MHTAPKPIDWNRGITVEFGQRAENVAGKQTVVYSSAIKPDNPEIVAAHAAGKRIVHRSDILALLMNGKRAVTVAGAHGKTTTSSMLSHILVNPCRCRSKLRHRRIHPRPGWHHA